ncbi:hypothetical protein IKE82_00830 [Candidatus Saccharibacteria bacterium]|nr:hypothetical protein [Candidatus Saccharibacteria bacterium]
MVRIFTGDDRICTKHAIEQILKTNHEVIEGENVDPSDLPTIFYGNSLFNDVRHILINDLEASKAAWEKLPEYLSSPHEIIIWETKLDKRTTTYKTLKKVGIEIREFTLPKDPNAGLVFNVYKTAKRNGKHAVEMLKKIEPTQEPMMFFGLMVSQAIKDYTFRQGAKEKRALKALSKLDIELKSAAIEPWLLIESFLIRLASL